MEPEAAGKVIGEKEPKQTKWGWKAVAAVAALVMVAGGLVWNFYWRTPRIEPASVEKMAFPLPDKPSIAVLPFVNMSDDKEQEYFADGLVEEIISGLTKVEHVFVIARYSTFTYKGKSVKVQQVAEEMGVRYVLEGSVRKIGEKVRITTQLVDALSGRYIFSERYDCNFKDILPVQEEITMSILTALQVSLTKGETARLVGKGTKNLEAYLRVLKSMQQAQQFNKEGTALARRYAEEAIALDPGYAMGYLALSQAIAFETVIGASKLPRTEAWQQALELADKAVALDPSSSTYSHRGVIYNFVQQPEKAFAEAEKAIALGPNDPWAYDCMGAALSASERFHDAIPMYEKALRLSPIPRSASLLLRLGSAYRFVGQNEDAIGTFRRLLQLYPDNGIGHALLTATYASAGRGPEARVQAAEVLRVDPNFSAERLVKGFMVKNKTLLDQIVADLHKTGLK
jgi:adenylate cyclase